MHDKIHISHESVNNLIWVHCLQEVFVGHASFLAAVHKAVYNRGNIHVAEVLKMLNIPSSEAIVTFLHQLNQNRIKR
jgi:hypothetical protein